MQGGEKDDRGCVRNYKDHELFRQDAKLCFSVISSTEVKEKVSLEVSMEDKEGALLQIMKILSLKPSYNNLF